MDMVEWAAYFIGPLDEAQRWLVLKFGKQVISAKRLKANSPSSNR